MFSALAKVEYIYAFTPGGIVDPNESIHFETRSWSWQQTSLHTPN